MSLHLVIILADAFLFLTLANSNTVFGSQEFTISSIPANYSSNPPVIISQIELDSAFAFYPDNQTCTSPPMHGFNNNCLTNLVPNHKVQCDYFIGSKGCAPEHQYTSGSNQSCLDPNTHSAAPQWFDMYNTQNKTVQIRLYEVLVLQNEKFWGQEGVFSTMVNLGPYGKCTYGFGPIDEPLSLDQTNMSALISYTYNGKNYTTHTPPLTDIFNDSRTWQFDGSKWNFAEQNTVTVPEFPFAIPVLLASITSLIVFYRMKFRLF